MGTRIALLLGLLAAAFIIIIFFFAGVDALVASEFLSKPVTNMTVGEMIAICACVAILARS